MMRTEFTLGIVSEFSQPQLIVPFGHFLPDAQCTNPLGSEICW